MFKRRDSKEKRKSDHAQQYDAKRKKSDVGNSGPATQLKRRVELPAVESSAAPIFGVQPLVLSDDYLLSVSAVRARALLDSGSRLKHIQQSTISTVLDIFCWSAAKKPPNERPVPPPPPTT